MDAHQLEALLAAPFAVEEHGFLAGNPYIYKWALRARLTQIDPRWTNTPAEVVTVHVSEPADIVVMRGGLVLLGVTRYAVGTGIILKLTRDGKPISPGYMPKNIEKAYKQAARDILPRAALEFGIGEYLRNLPKKDDKSTITSPTALAAWLKTLPFPGERTNSAPQQQPPAPQQQQRDPLQFPPTDAAAAGTSQPPAPPQQAGGDDWRIKPVALWQAFYARGYSQRHMKDVVRELWGVDDIKAIPGDETDVIERMNSHEVFPQWIKI